MPRPPPVVDPPLIGVHRTRGITWLRDVNEFLVRFGSRGRVIMTIQAGFGEDRLVLRDLRDEPVGIPSGCSPTRRPAGAICGTSAGRQASCTRVAAASAPGKRLTDRCFGHAIVRQAELAHLRHGHALPPNLSTKPSSTIPVQVFVTVWTPSKKSGRQVIDRSIGIVLERMLSRVFRTGPEAIGRRSPSSRARVSLPTKL
jgi:hypothetical protein